MIAHFIPKNYLKGWDFNFYKISSEKKHPLCKVTIIIINQEEN